MKFICPEHGEVKPSKTGYSSPMTGWCPECNRQLSDCENGGIKILEGEEAYRMRPSIYHQTLRNAAPDILNGDPLLEDDTFMEFACMRIVTAGTSTFEQDCKNQLERLAEEWRASHATV